MRQETYAFMTGTPPVPAALTANGSTLPRPVLHFRERTVQVTGPFVASVVVEGSMDGTSWGAVADALTGPGIVVVVPAVGYLRLTVAGYTSGIIAGSFSGFNGRTE
jgi:hypothetical protein